MSPVKKRSRFHLITATAPRYGRFFALYCPECDGRDRIETERTTYAPLTEEILKAAIAAFKKKHTPKACKARLDFMEEGK